MADPEYLPVCGPLDLGCYVGFERVVAVGLVLYAVSVQVFLDDCDALVGSPLRVGGVDLYQFGAELCHFFSGVLGLGDCLFEAHDAIIRLSVVD